MARFKDKCPQCGREFDNYNEPRAYRRHCSVGCQAAWAREDPPSATAECAEGAKKSGPGRTAMGEP